MSRSPTREQMTSLLQSVLCLVLFVVLLQLWLLNATLTAWLGGDESNLWTAAVASMVCCVANVGLLRYLQRLEQAACVPGVSR